MSKRDKIIEALNTIMENLDDNSLSKLCYEWLSCDKCPLNYTRKCNWECETDILKYLMEDEK